MARVTLQDMVNEIRLDALPVNWHAFDLATFSKGKQLWGYQQEAVENAVKALWRYYEDENFVPYQPNEDPQAHRARKERFFQWYRDNGLKDTLDLRLAANRNAARLLREYYEAGQNDILPYEPFINRACFWMATGSGKTLVIVKLIEVLRELIRRGEVPPHDILVLTHRDDLIEQLRRHVAEFNAARSDLFIRLRELREYPAAKRENPTLFKERELTVFYYRSDNLSDEQKEKIVDFKNYDDNGKWFVLLDEAHKGDKEDSKPQHIYSILSRSGFLFNFSATFTDVRDLVTTAYNFNLNDLEQYGQKPNNKFEAFDWWLFSKLDESLDEVYIPYYNPDTNRLSQFKPDFIFWLQKGSNYFIVFVDPHGTEHIEWEWKVSGYRQIFETEDNRRRGLTHEGLKVKVFAFLFTDNVDKVPASDKKRYWCDTMDRALGCVLNHA